MRFECSRFSASSVGPSFCSKNRVLARALLVQALLYCNAFGAVFLLSIYMQSVLGSSANVAGQVLAVGTILMALIAPAGGALADRTRPGIIASSGVAVALAAAALGAFLDQGSSLVAVGLVL